MIWTILIIYFSALAVVLCFFYGTNNRNRGTHIRGSYTIYGKQRYIITRNGRTFIVKEDEDE